MEAWIREKELLVSQGDLGKDYEHCMELQRKLNDAGSGATRGVDKELKPKERKSAGYPGGAHGSTVL